MPFSEKWFGSGLVDYGGTSSDEKTWQAIATVGYQFNDHWSTRMGYRYMSIDHVSDDIPTTIDLSGWLIGASYSF